MLELLKQQYDNFLEVLGDQVKFRGEIFPSEEISEICGKQLHREYVLPYGFTADYLAGFLRYHKTEAYSEFIKSDYLTRGLLYAKAREYSVIIDNIYNELIRLNPELGEISIDVTVRPDPKYDIILGAISKFSVKDIEFYLTKLTIILGTTYYLASEVVDGIIVPRDNMEMEERTKRYRFVLESVGCTIQYVMNDDDLNMLYDHYMSIDVEEEIEEEDDAPEFDSICVGNELTVSPKADPDNGRRYSIVCQEWDTFTIVSVDEEKHRIDIAINNLIKLSGVRKYMDTVQELILEVDELMVITPEGYY